MIALGASTDDTTAIAPRTGRGRCRGSGWSTTRVNDIPVGLNLAIAASRHPVVIRVDAHAELPAGYTARRWSRSCGAPGRQRGRGDGRQGARTPFQRAVARAYNSPVRAWAAGLAPRRRTRPDRPIRPTSASSAARCWTRSAATTRPCAARRTGSSTPASRRRSPGLFTPDAGGHLLAARHAGTPAPPDVRHRGLARTPGPRAGTHSAGATCRRRWSPCWSAVGAGWSGCCRLFGVARAAPAGRWRTCRRSATSPA